MADDRKLVVISKHYRMYVPGDKGRFSADETVKIVAGGFGRVVEGEEVSSDAPSNPSSRKKLKRTSYKNRQVESE